MAIKGIVGEAKKQSVSTVLGFFRIIFPLETTRQLEGFAF